MFVLIIRAFRQCTTHKCLIFRAIISIQRNKFNALVGRKENAVYCCKTAILTDRCFAENMKFVENKIIIPTCVKIAVPLKFVDFVRFQVFIQFRRKIIIYKCQSRNEIIFSVSYISAENSFANSVFVQYFRRSAVVSRILNTAYLSDFNISIKRIKFGNVCVDFMIRTEGSHRKITKLKHTAHTTQKIVFVCGRVASQTSRIFFHFRDNGRLPECQTCPHCKTFAELCFVVAYNNSLNVRINLI